MKIKFKNHPWIEDLSPAEAVILTYMKEDFDASDNQTEPVPVNPSGGGGNDNSNNNWFIVTYNEDDDDENILPEFNDEFDGEVNINNY